LPQYRLAIGVRVQRKLTLPGRKRRLAS